jgi:hypothetical protein
MSDSLSDIVRLVTTHPRSDFYPPGNVSSQLPEPVIATRRLVRLSSERCFLRAMKKAAEARPDVMALANELVTVYHSKVL